MVEIDQRFRQQVQEKIKDTDWFKAARRDLQAKARFGILVVEMVECLSFYRIVGGPAALFAKCKIGNETKN